MAFPGLPGGAQNPEGMADAQTQTFQAQQRVAAAMFQQSCLAKTAMAGVGGFAIGGAMGMFFSAMRYDAPGAFALPGGAPGMPGMPGGFNPDMKWHRALYVGLKDMGSSSLRTAKSFGKLGLMFTATECVIESYRAKTDAKNPTLAGCLVGAWLGRNGGLWGICGGCAGFAAFSYAIELYMHRETEDED